MEGITYLAGIIIMKITAHPSNVIPAKAGIQRGIWIVGSILGLNPRTTMTEQPEQNYTENIERSAGFRTASVF